MMFLLLACAHKATVFAPIQYGAGILEVQVRPDGQAQLEGNLMGPVEPYGGNFELKMCSSVLKYMVEAGGYRYGYCRLLSGEDDPTWSEPLLRRTGNLVWIGPPPPAGANPDVVLVVRPSAQIDLVTRMGRTASGGMDGEVVLKVQHEARYEWWNRQDGSVAVLGRVEDHRQWVVSEDLWDALQTPTLPLDTPQMVQTSVDALVRKMEHTDVPVAEAVSAR
jgi:hypothetical protein